MNISITKEIQNAAKTLRNMIFDVPKKQKRKTKTTISKSIKKKRKPRKMKKLSSFY